MWRIELVERERSYVRGGESNAVFPAEPLREFLQRSPKVDGVLPGRQNKTDFTMTINHPYHGMQWLAGKWIG